MRVAATKVPVADDEPLEPASYATAAAALLARRVPVAPQDIAADGESAAHRPVQFLTADLVRLHRICGRAMHVCRRAHAAVAVYT